MQYILFFVILIVVREMYFNYNDKKYEIVIIRKNNKNTYIRVKDDLKIYVTTSLFTSDNMILKLVNENYSTITRMIDKEEVKVKRNEKCMILGVEVDVIQLSIVDSYEFSDNKLYVKDISKLDKYLKSFTETIFKERLDKIYSNFKGVPYPKLKIRRMTTRWGVCNKKDKSITLNTELIKMDLKYLDYVIIHELSHFIYFDHSKNFWATVSKYCPNYKELRKEMRE